MIRKALGGVIVTCDGEAGRTNAARCASEFRTASDPSVVTKQLEHIGWEVTRTKRETFHRCPGHKAQARNRMPDVGGTGRLGDRS